MEEKHSAEGTWRSEVEKRLTLLKKLDGLPIIRDMDDQALMQPSRPVPDAMDSPHAEE